MKKALEQNSQDLIILVNENDIPLGTCEKIETHRKALLHRAFSIFIFNDNGEFLIQKRADDKYHSGGLWTNSCCSHPNCGEQTQAAAKRRLKEEMGIENCPLTHLFEFIYKAEFGNGLTEYEYDHVFIGKINNKILDVNKSEVSDYKWISKEDLIKEIEQTPELFTAWFKIILKQYLNFLKQNNEQ